jgi:hypothetical protein
MQTGHLGFCIMETTMPPQNNERSNRQARRGEARAAIKEVVNVCLCLDQEPEFCTVASQPENILKIWSRAIDGPRPSLHSYQQLYGG